jgi:hypothetical protein
VGQGNDGGAKGSSTYYPGGGGGAGAAGTGGGTGRGHGGDGIANDILGTSYYWAGGGGGSGYTGGPGNGGKGGGGGGGQGVGGNGGTGGILDGSSGQKAGSSTDNDAPGGDGAHGTGGGGGGGGWTDGKGGNGGSGIVIVKGIVGEQTINRLVEIEHVSYDTTSYTHVINFKKTGTGGDHIRYKIDNGSYTDTASGVYTLSTILSSSQRTGSGIKYTAYLADSSNNQLGTKKTFSYNPLTPIRGGVSQRIIKLTIDLAKTTIQIKPNADIEDMNNGTLYIGGINKGFSNNGAGWNTRNVQVYYYITTASNFFGAKWGWQTSKDGSGNKASPHWERSNDGGITWTNATISSGGIGFSFNSNRQRYGNAGSTFTLDISDDSYEYRLRDS